SRSVDEPFVRLSSSKEYYHADALGSPSLLTNELGIESTRYSFEAFGRTVSSGSSTNSVQYTGRENDGTGLYYYRYRYYDPNKQRFITEDPVRASAIHNFYVYVANS